jgi:hypothetical protein
MKGPTRIYYTKADKVLMWGRWQKGESLNLGASHNNSDSGGKSNALSWSLNW